MALALRLAADLRNELRVLHRTPAARAEVIHVRARALVGREGELHPVAMRALGGDLADAELHAASVNKADAGGTGSTSAARNCRLAAAAQRTEEGLRRAYEQSCPWTRSTPWHRDAARQLRRAVIACNVGTTSGLAAPAQKRGKMVTVTIYFFQESRSVTVRLKTRPSRSLVK